MAGRRAVALSDRARGERDRRSRRHDRTACRRLRANATEPCNRRWRGGQSHQWRRHPDRRQRAELSGRQSGRARVGWCSIRRRSSARSRVAQASYRMMLELAEDARAGRIEVLILNKTNPVFALPAAAGFKEALAGIPLIVSLSSFMDETTALADLILPSHTYLESWGDDFPEPGVGFPVGAISQPVVSPLVRHARDRRHHPGSRAAARSRRRAALDEHGGLSSSKAGARFINAVRRTAMRKISKRSGSQCCRPACGARTPTAQRIGR